MGHKRTDGDKRRGQTVMDELYVNARVEVMFNECPHRQQATCLHPSPAHAQQKGHPKPTGDPRATAHKDVKMSLYAKRIILYKQENPLRSFESFLQSEVE